MKKTLIIMLSIAVLFGFAACDNTTEPAAETVVDYQFATDADVEKLNGATSSLTYDKENECATISTYGAYYQLPMENDTYTLTYDLTIVPATEGTTLLDLNHNFVTTAHEGQAYVSMTIGTDDVKITGKPETSSVDTVDMGTVTFNEGSATIAMKAVYEKTENGGKVTVTANGESALSVTIPSEKTPEDIFWCISQATTAAGCSIDNFKVTTK